MALVDSPPSHSDLQEAAAEGRVRELVVGLFARIRGEPQRAGEVLGGANRVLRSLRSRQRRWVLDGLFDLVRHTALLERLTGSTEPTALWVGWLVRLGLDPQEGAALSGLAVDFGRCVHWEDETAREVRDLGAVEAIALLGSVAPVVAAQLLSRFGSLDTRAFLAASNQRAPVTLRANRRKMTRAALIGALEADGHSCRPGRWARDSVILTSRANLPSLELFKQGTFEVQDEGSQLLAELVQPEGLVIDLCAGAGGKTLALASMGASRLVATDPRERALHQLHKRAQRAGARVEVHLLAPDGSLPRAVARLRADRVLVDAPCTGIGVLRRHPEHRLRVNEARIEAAVALQGAILDRGATVVKPGGRLIYGTCSVLPAENERVLHGFLDRHPEFRRVPAHDILGPDHGEVLATAPHTHGTDGFYGAVVERSR